MGVRLASVALPIEQRAQRLANYLLYARFLTVNNVVWFSCTISAAGRHEVVSIAKLLIGG